MTIAINKMDGQALVTQNIMNSCKADKVDALLATEGGILTALNCNETEHFIYKGKCEYA